MLLKLISLTCHGLIGGAVCGQNYCTLDHKATAQFWMLLQSAVHMEGVEQRLEEMGTRLPPTEKTQVGEVAVWKKNKQHDCHCLACKAKMAANYLAEGSKNALIGWGWECRPTVPMTKVVHHHVSCLHGKLALDCVENPPREPHHPNENSTNNKGKDVWRKQCNLSQKG